ncbi:MAG TPA: 4Fe-4S dicluster domain-containing protein [Chloroflexota bacterium]|nr:4Fe-4S dicluster domain-containing protein [Chloroflexota bacterium]
MTAPYAPTLPATEDGQLAGKGFFTDTSVCIGCKACEVACKQWNQLPMDDLSWDATSYDNTHALSATTWRHVTFAELPGAGGAGGQTDWLMMSDVCKHCQHAGCLEACPTGAIVRTEFNTVLVQQDVCNGCGYCVPSCPYGVIDLDMEHSATTARDGKAHKCTLCYDRLTEGLEPACAKACPTDAIQFGDVADLRRRADERVGKLRAEGLDAYIYGDEQMGGGNGIGHLNAFFLLLDEPSKYNLPEAPSLPQNHTLPGILTMAATAIGLGLATAWTLGRK